MDLDQLYGAAQTVGHDLEVEATIRVRAAAQLADAVTSRVAATFFEGAQPRLELLLCLDDVGPAVTNVLDGDHLKEAIELFSQTSEIVELAHTYRHLGDLLIKQGRRDKGYEAHRQGLLALERGL